MNKYVNKIFKLNYKLRIFNKFSRNWNVIINKNYNSNYKLIYIIKLIYSYVWDFFISEYKLQ